MPGKQTKKRRGGATDAQPRDEDMEEAQADSSNEEEQVEGITTEQWQLLDIVAKRAAKQTRQELLNKVVQSAIKAMWTQFDDKFTSIDAKLTQLSKQLATRQASGVSTTAHGASANGSIPMRRTSDLIQIKGLCMWDGRYHAGYSSIEASAWLDLFTKALEDKSAHIIDLDASKSLNTHVFPPCNSYQLDLWRGQRCDVEYQASCG